MLPWSESYTVNFRSVLNTPFNINLHVLELGCHNNTICAQCHRIWLLIDFVIGLLAF